jgi:hypothetical protein
MIRRLAIGPLAAAAVLVLSAAPALGSTVSASSGGLSATLHAGTHHPKVNHHWPIRVSATLNGHSVRGAGAYYQFLYNGQQVSKQAICPNSGTTNCKNFGFKFNGGFSDFLLFPSRSVGFPLTLRVVVSAGGHTVYLAYSVQVVK